ncbi:MAG TPA: hypothetical protein VFB45_10370 [Pseudolabrys sp.]|nr:hypothetical protein [Pseudolabrys sp.]
MRLVATKPVSIAIAGLLLGITNLAIWFPGESGPDSQSQYWQAVTWHLDDWHPPITVWLWSLFRLVTDGDGPMFCFQVILYWLGFLLIAFTLSRTGRWVAAWAVLAVALFPSLFTTNIELLNDVGMGVTFLAAFAMVFWWRMQDRKIPTPVAAIALALLVFGALARVNAVFAVVPLFVYLIRPQWLGKPWRLLAVSIPLALALVPVADLINHRLLRAEPLHPIRSLQVFDLNGIAFYSHDLTVFGPGTSFTQDELARCYTPAGWDRAAPWGKCRFFWDRLAVSPDLRELAASLDARGAMGLKPNPDLSNRWIAAIVHHPLAYAEHRLLHFGSEIGEGLSMWDSDAAGPKPLSVALYDLVTASALWIVMGAGLLVCLTSMRSVRRSASIDAALALLLSALPYASAYLIIGVASQMRYFFWSLVAIFTAAVIASAECRSRRSDSALA